MFYEDAIAMKLYSNSPASNRNIIEIHHLMLDIDFPL